MGLLLGLILAGIALVVLGLVIHGLFNLLIIGAVVIVLSLIFGGLRGRRARRRAGR
jgi:hypothetical protein